MSPRIAHIISLVTTSILLAGNSTASLAQNAPSGMTRYNRAPVSKELLRVHLPHAVQSTLANGLKVLVLEDHRAAQIRITMYIHGAGGLFDPPGQHGLANMTAQMLSLGTATMNARQVAQAIDKDAASVSVFTSSSSPTATLSATGLSSNFHDWFPVVTDIMLHPSFPNDELAGAKQRQISQLQAQQTNSEFLVNKYLRKTLYGDTPEGQASATPESTRAFTVEALRQFYTERYASQNTIVIVEGDISPQQAFAAFGDALKGWNKNSLQVRLPPVTTETAPRSVTLVERPNSVQTNIAIGRLGIDRRDPDYVKLAVTNDILGVGAAGRLFMRLREEKSYTYGAYSTLDTSEYRGVIAASSEVRTAVTGGALDEFFREFTRLGTEQVSDEELERHRHAMVASFALSLESPQALMNYVYTQVSNGFPADYWDTYPTSIAAVSSADVMAMGKKYYAPDTLQVVAVGDPSIKPSLARWGEVQDVKP